MKPDNASLLALINVESARRGLSRVEMIDCLSKAVVATYARRGFHVQVEIDQSNLEEGLKMIVRKMLVQGGDTVEQTVRDILIPTQEDLAVAVQELRAAQRKLNPWALCEAKVLSVFDDHYLVEPTNGFGCGQVAVLPKAHAGSKLEKNENIMCVAQPFRAEKVTGLQPWMTIQAPLIASRIDRQLIIQMVHVYFDMTVDAAVISGAAMIITPPGKSISALISKENKALDVIKAATGLTRVFVGPMGARHEPRFRLQNAVHNVTGLKFPKDFRVSEPKDDARPSWRVYVATGQLGRFIGRDGQNLFFVMYLSGMQFDYLERPMWSKQDREAKGGDTLKSDAA